MKKIYISYNVEKEPTAIIAAESRREASIALAHMKSEAHTIEETDINNEQTIVFLLTSIQANSYHDFSHRVGGVDFRIWKRGV